MKKFEEKIELIEKYLEGTLDDENREKVEETIRDNEEFADQVNSYRMLMDGIKYSGRNDLLKNIKKWDEELADVPFTGVSSTKTRNFKWYYAAASIVFLLIAGVVINNLNSGYTGLVADVYKPYEFQNGATRGEKVELNTTQNLIDIYDKGDYQQVIGLINTLDETQKSDVTDFILANAYQETENYQEAINLYLKVVEESELYILPSKWYLALCYLSIDKKEEAVSYLNQIKDLKSFYGDKANNLLKKL